MTTNQTTEYTITLRAIPWQDDDRPGIVRLRGALKCLLRSFGLKCVRITEATPEATTTTIDTKGSTDA